MSPISTAKRAFGLAINFQGVLLLKMLVHRLGAGATDIMRTVRGYIAVFNAVPTEETAVLLLSILCVADGAFVIRHLVSHGQDFCIRSGRGRVVNFCPTAM